MHAIKKIINYAAWHCSYLCCYADAAEIIKRKTSRQRIKWNGAFLRHRTGKSVDG